MFTHLFHAFHHVLSLIVPSPCILSLFLLTFFLTFISAGLWSNKGHCLPCHDLSPLQPVHLYPLTRPDTPVIMRLDLDDLFPKRFTGLLFVLPACYLDKTIEEMNNSITKFSSIVLFFQTPFCLPG